MSDNRTDYHSSRHNEFLLGCCAVKNELAMPVIASGSCLPCILEKERKYR
ncbi:MAG: hypothetical protein LUQ36_03410 [Methanoregula sp.]|nr:hypothetical protein [Methanoregula sp.]